MPTRLSLLLLASSAAWTLACAGIGGDKGDTQEEEEPGLFEDKDKDDDGYLWDEDCNDDNAAIHPGAQEVCDPGDVDEDCDGLADVADDSTSGAITAYHDADGDGFGNPDEPVPVCEVIPGYVLDATDCDDAAPAVNTAAVEVCDDLVDNDCDGLLDNADDSVDDTTRIDVWEDADGDGFGDDTTLDRACFVATGYAGEGGDCDDTDALANPAADETCGGGDEDCDGTVDEDAAIDASTWYDDADGDGYGDPEDATVACDAPTRHVADGTDCDDTARANRPGADEYCDEEDNDCDGETDEDDALDASVWYADADRDGYGDVASPREACDPPASYVADATDCDDTSAAVRPGATEVCDSADTDEDCDGLADDADTSTSSSGKRAWYADTDGDGYGAATGAQRCDGGSGWASTNTDCDDTSATISPAGAEVCDAANADEDCDGRADDADSSVSAASKLTWYPDADGDGYGVPGTTRSQCDTPSGHASNDDDCDDADAGVSPGDAEVCDDADVDEDCDGLADDADTDMPATSRIGWAVDADDDGWGSGSISVYSCATPAGYAETGDCDDTDDLVHPDAADACTDEVDADCDGVTACSVTTADATIFTATWGGHGGRVAIVGDVDGDGVRDVASAAVNSTSAGEMVLLDVGAGAGSTSARQLVRAQGDGTYNYFGRSMSPVPDVDGDGEDDLAVADYGASAVGTNGGAVYVFAADAAAGTSGAASDLARTVVGGSRASGYLGYERIVGLDWDGDGDGEVLGLVQRTWTYYGYQMTAYVLDVETPGVHADVDDALYTIADGSEAFLFPYACAGDLTGDGLDDLVLESSGAVLRLYESTGASGSIASGAYDASWSSAATGDNFGMACATGDYDGDGRLDLAVGAPYGRGGGLSVSGSAYVFTDGPDGSTTDRATLAIAGTTAFANFGRAATFLPDLDGDGKDELVFGTSAYGGTVGEVGIFAGGSSGSVTTTDAQLTLVGRSVNDNFGASLAAADLDGDGLSDLVVGASNDDGGATDGGSVFVYFGADLFEP